MTLSLLALCARPRLPDGLVPELHARASAVDDWAEVLTVAERHGLGPLLYRHLRDGNVPIAPDVKAQLQAVYIRHRRANDTRLRALAEILDAFAEAGIETRVLKGPALMSLVYGEAALRPVSDLDILVPVVDALRAQQVLGTIGFAAPVRAVAVLESRHHLPIATRAMDGMTIQVEVHLDALSRDNAASIALGSAREVPLPFIVCGRQASTLGVHEQLWQVCEHLVGPLPRPMRLIWIADVMGLAETFHERIDWERIAREFTIVLNVLAFAHGLSPLSESVLRRLPPDVVAAQARGGRAAMSWTPTTAGVRAGGRWQQLCRTMNPPSWWIDLRYGRPTGFRRRLMRRLHYMAVFGNAGRRRLEARRG